MNRFLFGLGSRREMDVVQIDSNVCIITSPESSVLEEELSKDVLDPSDAVSASMSEVLTRFKSLASALL